MKWSGLCFNRIPSSLPFLTYNIFRSWSDPKFCDDPSMPRNMIVKTIAFVGGCWSVLMALSSTAIAAPTCFEAESFCHASSEVLAIQTIVDARYEYSEDTAKHLGYSSSRGRTFWRFKCSLQTSECEGFNIELSNLDAGKKVSFLDAVIVKGMKIAARTGNVFTLQWGPWRTLTIDLSAPKVLQYRVLPRFMRFCGISKMSACFQMVTRCLKNSPFK